MIPLHILPDYLVIIGMVITSGGLLLLYSKAPGEVQAGKYFVLIGLIAVVFGFFLTPRPQAQPDSPCARVVKMDPTILNTYDLKTEHDGSCSLTRRTE